MRRRVRLPSPTLSARLDHRSPGRLWPERSRSLAAAARPVGQPTLPSRTLLASNQPNRAALYTPDTWISQARATPIPSHVLLPHELVGSPSSPLPGLRAVLLTTPPGFRPSRHRARSRRPAQLRRPFRARRRSGSLSCSRCWSSRVLGRLDLAFAATCSPPDQSHKELLAALNAKVRRPCQLRLLSPRYASGPLTAAQRPTS